MTLIEHSPHFGAQTERVRQNLKDDVTIGWPVTLLAQGGQAKCMGGVVGEVEPALQRVGILGGIRQPS
jgi:hypothetical protein